MADNAYRLMKEIHKKWKQGFKIPNTQEYLSLIVLCASENRSERLAACKCVEYLHDWDLIEINTTLPLLAALASKTNDIDGVLAVSFNIVSNLCENDENYILGNDLKSFLQTISNIISSNENSVLPLLSVFGQLDVDFVLQYYKPVVYDIVFGDLSNRHVAWNAFSKRIDLDWLRIFFLWTKYTRIDDCLLLLDTLKFAPLPVTEKCLHLSAIIYHMMIAGFNPKDAVNQLLSYILETDTQIQTLALLSILFGIESYSDLFTYVVLDLCEWFLNNTLVWKEVLWIMLAYFIPLTKKSVFYPKYEIQAKELIYKLQKMIDTKMSVEIKPFKLDSVVLKHTIYRHECLYQSYFIIRVLQKFKADDGSLIEWLNKLLKCELDSAYRVMYAVIGNYFLTKQPEIRKVCLSLLHKWKLGSTELYIFQLSREEEPSVILELLRMLCTEGTSEDRNITHEIVNSLTKEEHENCFALKIDLLMKSGLKGYKLDDLLPVILSHKEHCLDIFAQAALTKAITNALSIHYEITIPFCNYVINEAKNKHATIATSLVIDAICSMCTEGILDVAILWNSLLAIVAGEYHPAVHSSVCNFLGKIPFIMRHRKDYTGIVYKSARVLWHFVNHVPTSRELALRCLRDYDLNVFDVTFLSDECKGHLKYASGDSVIPKIQGDCWLHMIKDSSLASLFCHYIDKKKLVKTRFIGSYSSLFNAVVKYLNKCPNDEINSIIICLKLLGAKWTSLPCGYNISVLDRFIENPIQEIRELTLFAALNLYPLNEYAKGTFNRFIQEKKFCERDKAIICRLPANLLDKYREQNENILFDGLLFSLHADPTENVFNITVEEAIIACAKNDEVHAAKRRIIMKILIALWMKIPLTHEVFKRVSKMLAAIYGYPFLKSLPYARFDRETHEKTIHLCSEIVLKTKSLYCFDSAISIGQKNESLQEYVIETFLYILKNLDEEKRGKNIKWILRILCTTTINGNDFMCNILVYGIIYLSGAVVLCQSLSLKECLDFFPLAISNISKTTGKGKYIILTLNELLNKRNKVHPIFIEVFKLAIMSIRDEPSVCYENAIRRAML